jgi:peptidoglycan/LPS O-acetylase OafA/YrhL
MVRYVDAPESKKYDPRLDSLRAISALAIIPFHWAALSFGWIGVQVFFVLSGMFITESLLKSKRRIGSLGDYLGYFFEKRMLRLFPLYYGFLLVLGVIYLFIGRGHEFLWQAPFLFTYTSNLSEMINPTGFIPGAGHLWSLGVEWQFYLLWPFLVWKLSEQSLIRVAMILVFVAPILREITILVAGSHTENEKILGAICYLAPWSHWDAIALGALIVNSEIRSLLSRAYCWIAVGTIAFIAGCLVVYFGKGSVPIGSLGYPYHLPYFHESIWGYSLIDLLAACLIALTAEKSPLTLFANWRPLQYLGKISYGIYVYNLPLVALVVYLRTNSHWPRGFGLWFVPLFALNITIAHLSYRYFESWFLRKKATLLPSPSQSQSDKTVLGPAGI